MGLRNTLILYVEADEEAEGKVEGRGQGICVDGDDVCYLVMSMGGAIQDYKYFFEAFKPMRGHVYRLRLSAWGRLSHAIQLPYHPFVSNHHNMHTDS